MENFKIKRYQLFKENGRWLGEVIITQDGIYTSLTDYGNFCFAWRSTGEKDFRKFLLSLEVGYFGTKMYGGITYIAYGKKFEKIADTYAEIILPILQKALKADIEENPVWE